MKDPRETIVAEWFAQHHASYHRLTDAKQDGVTGAEFISWRRPGTSIYAVHYMAHGTCLFVSGDLGDAVYDRERWIRWWAGLDLHYFASKCMASEYGRGYKSWDKDAGAAYIEDVFRDDVAGSAKFTELRGGSALSSEFEWIHWLGESGYDVWGADYSEHGNAGKIIDLRCVAHLVGLRMAVAQLGERAFA